MKALSLGRLLVRLATLFPLENICLFLKYSWSSNGPGPADAPPSLQPELYPDPSLHLVPPVLRTFAVSYLYRIKGADLHLPHSPFGSLFTGHSSRLPCLFLALSYKVATPVCLLNFYSSFKAQLKYHDSDAFMVLCNAFAHLCKTYVLI